MIARFLSSALVLALIGCAGPCPDQHDDQADALDREARGPHGGRLFESDDLQLELRIDENDGNPIFLSYLYDSNGSRRATDEATLEVTLERFANRVEVIGFSPVLNHLRSETGVREPHSFRATIDLEVGGRDYQWEYEQVEFRIELDPESPGTAGIEIAAVGPGRIEMTVTDPGEVRLNAERVLLVRPRFPGVVTELTKQMGSRVSKGEVLATIQSNESLLDYSIVATMDGTIVGRTGAVGAAVTRESILYTLADLSTVWVDFAIHPHDIGLVKAGQRVRLVATTRKEYATEATISYVGPLLEQDTRVSYARVVLPNPDGQWQPGLYVIATVLVEVAEVELAIPEEAIVRSRFGPAVFLAEGSNFELQPIETGRSDGKMTEVLTGLAPGELIVVRNSYLLKAELGRSEATHDH